METQQQSQPNIFQRILSIMAELDYIAKGDKTVNGQYRFVSHDQVTAKVHPMLVKHGVVVIPTIEDVKQESNRTTVKLSVVFVNVDNSAEQIVTHWYGQGVDNGDKGIGKAVSYAYKYALLKTFCLETGDDPDNDAKSTYEPPKCVEFDLALPADLDEKDMAKLDKFIASSAEAMGKHPEDLKRHALQNMDGFVRALKNYNPEKKKKEKN